MMISTILPEYMTPQSHSFRKLLPGFVIAAGTQVVLKVSKPLAEGERYKPPGSVGVVLKSPPNNSEPYLVYFTDGETVTAAFHELALRRREVEDELGEIDADMRPWIIYRCQVGSKAFGLANDESDDDLRGIYLPPARLHWSLRRLPEQLEFADAQRDEVYWEIEKFLRLALKANPSVLETLWTPQVLLADETADELRRCGGHSFQNISTRPIPATCSASSVAWRMPTNQRGPTSPSTRCTSSACSTRALPPWRRAKSASMWANIATNYCTFATTACRSRK